MLDKYQVLERVTVLRLIVYSAFFLWFAVSAEGAAETAKNVPVHGGVPVIEKLALEDFPVGRHHRYLLAGTTKTGQPEYVPIMVLKGSRPGKKLMLTASVHGDELNGIRVIHRLFDVLEKQEIVGTIVGVPGVNQSGMNIGSRYFSLNGAGEHSDLNRLFPGVQTGGGVAAMFAGKLWQSLFEDNADLVVDLHTQTQGASYPVFVFADFGNARSMRMAYDLNPDIIKNDAGQEGTLETAYMQEGVPAVTFELGQSDSIDATIVERAVAGILNLMNQEDMISAAAVPVTEPIKPYVGSDYSDVIVEEGGFAIIKVGLLDIVHKGDHIATVYDPFGNEKRRYFAPHAGCVLAISTAPLMEPGSMLVRIIR
ncbi:succinylglutamate desuccinylase/aspartoacylase family protein [Kordiimonas pumila]|uniref:Succinylglutamate desuccinylase/aspartoacylase family protein n=1 Tax=Kordiimonas pumila TaxID=2161677 RepID=A0ABV7CZW8_9PROT|nr:succinylglutamate desuccinylase/aspartoacylase family protein [Kordiimonas pumila]